MIQSKQIYLQASDNCLTSCTTTVAHIALLDLYLYLGSVNPLVPTGTARHTMNDLQKIYIWNTRRCKVYCHGISSSGRSKVGNLTTYGVFDERQNELIRMACVAVATCRRK